MSLSPPSELFQISRLDDAIDSVSQYCTNLSSFNILSILETVLDPTTYKNGNAHGLTPTNESIYAFVINYCLKCESVDDFELLLELLIHIGEVTAIYQYIVYINLSNYQIDIDTKSALNNLSKVNQLKLSDYPVLLIQYQLIRSRLTLDLNQREKSLLKGIELLNLQKNENENKSEANLNSNLKGLKRFEFELKFQYSKLLINSNKLTTALSLIFEAFKISIELDINESTDQSLTKSIGSNYKNLIKLLLLVPYSSTKLLILYSFIPIFKSINNGGSNTKLLKIDIEIESVLLAVNHKTIYQLNDLNITNLTTSLTNLFKEDGNNTGDSGTNNSMVFKNIMEMNIISIARVFTTIPIQLVFELIGLSTTTQLSFDQDYVLDLMFNLILEKKIVGVVDEVDGVIYLDNDDNNKNNGDGNNSTQWNKNVEEIFNSVDSITNKILAVNASN